MNQANNQDPMEAITHNLLKPLLFKGGHVCHYWDLQPTYMVIVVMFLSSITSLHRYDATAQIGST